MFTHRAGNSLIKALLAIFGAIPFQNALMPSSLYTLASASKA
jgi:hypothetical protein